MNEQSNRSSLKTIMPIICVLLGATLSAIGYIIINGIPCSIDNSCDNYCSDFNVFTCTLDPNSNLNSPKTSNFWKELQADKTGVPIKKNKNKEVSLNLYINDKKWKIIGLLSKQSKSGDIKRIMCTDTDFFFKLDYKTPMKVGSFCYGKKTDFNEDWVGDCNIGTKLECQVTKY